MQKFYFTLGQTRQHVLPLPEGDKVWNKDGVVCVQAEDEASARCFIHAMFGEQWSNCCSSIHDIKLGFYPNGIIHTYIIPPGTEL